MTVLCLDRKQEDGGRIHRPPILNQRYSPGKQPQYAAEAIVAPDDYKAIKVEAAYDNNVNTVYFDGIQLYKEAFGHSYVYDDDGNITSVKDLQEQTTTYEYENNNLTKQTLPTGTVLTYDYDNYHNIKTATSDTGVVYHFTYDAWGRPLTTTGTDATTLGAHNPLRYRGYVYDHEKTFYSQQDQIRPEILRFPV